jgi:uncharacterized spore protein YtfJ
MPFNFQENVNALFERLEKILTSKTVVGEEIKIGDTTLIPIVDIGFGMGIGGGDGTDDKGNGGVGSGGGIGVKASASAVIVIKGDEIQVLPLKKPGSLEKIIEMVPDIVAKFKDGNEQEESPAE